MYNTCKLKLQLFVSCQMQAFYELMFSLFLNLCLPDYYRQAKIIFKPN
jgi:hypothetical protein